MKNRFKVPALDRRSFYILKNGLFLIITMLAITMLKYNSLSYTESFRLFFALPLARIMLEHTLITFVVVIAAALACDAVVKNSKNI